MNEHIRVLYCFLLFKLPFVVAESEHKIVGSGYMAAICRLTFFSMQSQVSIFMGSGDVVQ